MAVNIKSTADVHSNGIKALVYGHAGSGKTSLASTLPSPIIISAEGGLLPLSEVDIPYIEVKTIADVEEAFEWLTKEGDKYKSVVIDSLSEIAEVVLSYELDKNKDGRAAYGEMASQMTALIRAFRDLPNKNVLMTAKAEKVQDESGKVLYGPSMPGNKLSQSLPYFFDLVMALRVDKDSEGNVQRALMTEADGLWQAKDRSGRLDAWEAPNLLDVIAKIGGDK